MKQIMDNKLTQTFFKVALIAMLGILSGCLVTLSHFTGGNVSSDLGADCTFNCVYQLNEGESLDRIFTAQPLPGNDFIRWYDSLGDNFSMCPQPTQRECNLVINNLHPLFEGQTLDVVAQFRAVNGYNANAVGFMDTATTAQGTFRQIDDITWIESYPNATPINYFYTEARTQTRLVIYDRFADVRYFFDFSTGIIQQQIGMAPTAAWGSVLGRSATPSGWLVAQAQFGDPNGSYKGDYIQTDPDTWVFRKKGKSNDKYTFTEMARDDTTVSLHDESRSVDIVINLADGMVYSSQLSGPLQSVGVVQRSLTAATAFTVSEVSHGSDASDIQGYFIEQGSNGWSQIAADGKTQLAEFELLRRSSTEIELIDSEDTVRVVINLSTQEINLLGVPVPLSIERFDIVEAK